MEILQLKGVLVLPKNCQAENNPTKVTGETETAGQRREEVLIMLRLEGVASDVITVGEITM